MESLFSLEVIINFVKLTTKTTCLFPSVAIRLLDYPIIAINLIDECDSNLIKTHIDSNDSLNEKLPCFVELVDKHGRFIFSRGKSCLFRSELNVLKNNLKSTPLYLMLLDSFHKPYKLIGTVLVPLTNLINLLSDEFNETKSKDIPVSKMTHGILNIKNLLGEELGHVSFACRLTCYGESILSHIKAKKTSTDAFIPSLNNKSITEVNEIKCNMEKNLEKIDEKNELFLNELRKTSIVKIDNTSDVLIQEVIDNKDAETQINQEFLFQKESKISQQIKDNSTKSKQDLTTKSKNVFSIKREPDSLNHCSPPALVLNNFNKESNSLHKVNQSNNQENVLNERIKYLNNIYNNSLYEKEDNQKSLSELKLSIEKKDDQNFGDLQTSKFIEEINIPYNIQSLSNNTQKADVGIIKNTAQIKAVNKNIASKQESKKSVKRCSILNKQENSTNKQEIVRPLNNKKKPPLKYWTTNTYRMRVLANNPTKMKEINTQHKKLMNEIKTNVDSLNLSKSYNTAINDPIRNNLEKVFFESTVLSSEATGILTSTLQRKNFSLLNKVELDSTNNDTLYANKSKQLDEINNKTVQFGNTYVLDTSYGDELTKFPEKNSESFHLNEYSNSSENFDEDELLFTRNVFLENKSYDDDDDDDHLE